MCRFQISAPALVIFCLLSSAPIALAQVEPLGRWITRSPLLTPRQEMPLALWNGKVYVPGGFVSGGDGTAIVEVFDPATNQWTNFPALPTALNHLTIVTVNGRLFVVGGYDGGSFSSQGRVYEYALGSQSWIRRADMRPPRGAHVALPFDGKIYAIGGANGSTALNINEAYDPATDSWELLAPMPTAREHLAAAVIDSLIYVVGGRRSSFVGMLNNYGTLEAYSPATNQWYSLPNMPTPRGGLAAAAMNGRLYVFGGEYFTSAGEGVFEENEEYDPVTQTWRQVAPLPTPRHGMNAITVGDTIFVIGGGPVAGYGVTAVNEGFTITIPSTSVDREPNLATDFLLRQNYPNPFNAGTRISFTLPVLSEVRLSVHNLAGQELAVLVDKRMGAGAFGIQFNNETLPSGMYFYTLKAGKEVLTRKMVVVH